MDNFENQNVYENQSAGNVPPMDYKPKFDSETGEPLYPQNDQPQQNGDQQFQQTNYNRYGVESQQAPQPQQYSQYGQQNVQPQYEQPQQYNQYGQQNYQSQYNQQQYGQYQQPMQYQQPAQEANGEGRGLAIASLVLGIVSFLCCGSVCSIIGLILGIVSRSKQKENNGMAVAGIVLSAVALVIWGIYIAYAIISSGSSGYNYYDNYFNY